MPQHKYENIWRREMDWIFIQGPPSSDFDKIHQHLSTFIDASISPGHVDSTFLNIFRHSSTHRIMCWSHRNRKFSKLKISWNCFEIIDFSPHLSTFFNASQTHKNVEVAAEEDLIGRMVSTLCYRQWARGSIPCLSNDKHV